MDEDGFLNPDDEDLEQIDFGDEEEEPSEEAETKPPPNDYVVHVYECGNLTRTIQRRFTAEEAETFASEYNRTSKAYGRFAVTGKEKGRPKKVIEWDTQNRGTR